MTTERRARILTEADKADIEAIFGEQLKRLDQVWAAQMESIGLDVTTAESRAVIRSNNEFLADLRVGSRRAKVAAWGAGISAFVTGALYMFWITLKAALSAKGAG